MKLSDTKSTESTQFSIISTSIGFFHCDVVEITLQYKYFDKCKPIIILETKKSKNF